MAHPSPFSQPHPGAAASIVPPPASPPPVPMGRARRRTGAVLVWVAGVLALALILLAGYVLSLLGPEASVVGVVLASIPFVGVWVAIRAVDRWEPEPRGLLLFAVAWGAIASVTIALGVDLVISLVAGGTGEVFAAVVQAPVVEETAKALGVLLLYAAARRSFDGPVDGVVYGALVGAGFAFTENVLYFAESFIEGGVADLSVTFFLRALLSPFAHVMFTCLTGFAFGLAARRSLPVGGAVRLGLVGLVGAILLHALWNGSSVLGDFFALYLTMQVPLFVCFVVGVLALRREESRLTRARLGEYAEAGWFTAQEVDMLATGRGRRSALAWARTLRGDRRPVMRTFIADATALAAARQRALSGRDPHAVADERQLLEKTAAARAALFAP